MYSLLKCGYVNITVSFIGKDPETYFFSGMFHALQNKSERLGMFLNYEIYHPYLNSLVV